MGQSTSKAAADPSAVVTIPSRGSIAGALLTDVESGTAKTQRFTRVPYVRPPVGELRWRRPVPLASDFQYDQDGRTYHEFGPACPVPNNYAMPVSKPPPPHAVSEDCLHLNIWVPVDPSTKQRKTRLPVLFFIHGGWLQTGNAHLDTHKDPSDLITSGGLDAIVVCPAYRLNAFGFLAHPSLRSQDTHALTGNYGFWDQRAALEWVADNISHFGGDPNNITVGGLSAGAHSTHLQLLYEFARHRADPSFSPLIKRVFLQSNAAVWPAKTVDEAAPQLDQLASLLDLPDHLSAQDKIAHLRTVPAEDIVAVIPKMRMHTFRAVRDDVPGSFVTSDTFRAMQDGSFASWCSERGVTFLLGETDREEAVYEIVNTPRDAQDLEVQLNNYYPLELVRAMLPLYAEPASEHESGEHEREREREVDMDLYATLGVSRSASGAAIRAAYLALVREHHPDRNGSSVSAPLIRRLNHAYATLSDGAARAAYDRVLAARPGPGPGEGGMRIAAHVDVDALVPVARFGGEGGLAFSWPCRCGHEYEVSASALEGGMDVFACTGCSELIRVDCADVGGAFGMACADSQVYVAQRVLLADLGAGALRPTDVLRYRIDYRAPPWDALLPAHMGVSHSFDDPIWWHAWSLPAWTPDATHTARLWTRPLHAFLHADAHHAALAWYDNRIPPSPGAWIRTLHPDGSISVQTHDQRADEKSPITAALVSARTRILA